MPTKLRRPRATSVVSPFGRPGPSWVTIADEHVYTIPDVPITCWICGDPGDTGEHMIKRSDLKALFGPHVSQDRPLYVNSATQRNQKIGSTKAKKLKFRSRLCSNCNNDRTANSDESWRVLSEFLQKPFTGLNLGQRILNPAELPGTGERSMLEVHLYFVKYFGCCIVDSTIPIDIVPFREAIIHKKPHPNLYLTFGLSKTDTQPTSAGRSNLDTNSTNGECVLAQLRYAVGAVSVMVTYSAPDHKPRNGWHLWHPTESDGFIFLHEFHFEE